MRSIKWNPGAFTAIGLVLGACGGASTADPARAGGGSPPAQPFVKGGIGASAGVLGTGAETGVSAPGTGASGPGVSGGQGGSPAMGGALAVGGVRTIGGATASGGVPELGGSFSTGGIRAFGGWASCTDTVAESEPAPSVLMFVADASSSMDQDAYPSDDARNWSKWQELQTVLPRALGTFPSNWAVGYASFRYQTDGSCQGRTVPIAPVSASQISLVEEAMTDSPGGPRAAPAGWLTALTTVKNWSDPSYNHGPRSIVLITDGPPNVTADCSGFTSPFLSPSEYASWVTMLADEGERAGVRTFVVGLLGSQDPMATGYDPLYMLSQLAAAGGTAPPGCTPAPGTSTGTDLDPRGTYCHYDTTENPEMGVALESALQQIRREATSCSYPVTPPPGMIWDPISLTISYPADGIERILTRASTQSCSDGQWYVSQIDETGLFTELELCPGTCELVKTGPEATLTETHRCIVAP
jgi:hypothetical protein